MRKPEYISPTSLSLWNSDRSEFYLKYLADNRPPKMPQTRPMSVGSAFDAYTKSWMVEKLFGVGAKLEFSFETLFEAQVELQNRDWARTAGKVVFDAYMLSGALMDLMSEIELCVGEPRFETRVRRDVDMPEIFKDGPLPFLGIPDLLFTTSAGVAVIIDWKVNGYCGNSNVSPKPGYILVRDGWAKDTEKASRNTNVAHKNCILENVGGMQINIAAPLEQVDETWANQLSIYGWMEGELVGSKFLVGIEQLCAKPTGGATPLLRVASHRSRVSAPYQMQLYVAAKTMWRAIESGHIFDDLSVSESNEKCETLDDYYLAFDEDEGSDKKWLMDIVRQHNNF